MPRSHAKHTVGETCPRCQAVHVTRTGAPACVGHSRDGSGRACKLPPRPDMNVCHTHGGGSPNAKDAAEQRDTDRKAAEIMRRFGEPVDTTPTEALLDAVKWTAGYVAWLRDKVASTETDRDTMDGVPAERVALVNEERALTQMSNVTGKREASVWLDLLGTWHDRLVRICAEAIKAGIEERRVRIAEQQGALVADVIRKILDDLGLTPEQASRAGEVVPFRLRALAG